MLLRVRVSLPDRPGSLGQVARTIGVTGADIVQVVVLERHGGRAVDDFTVVWPGGAGIERLRAGLGAMPGVRLDGVSRAIGSPVTTGYDGELLTHVAANPDAGLSTLVDAVPNLLAADWAAALTVPADWPVHGGSLGAEAQNGAGGLRDLPEALSRPSPSVIYASWRAPHEPRLPDITPLRARSIGASDGTRYAVVPFGREGLVLLITRAPQDDLPVAAFHTTELDRLAQLVRAASIIIGGRLPEVVSRLVAHAGGRHPRRDPGPRAERYSAPADQRGQPVSSPPREISRTNRVLDRGRSLLKTLLPLS